ncbi:hypothetical protein MKX01_017126 [Papaver californicum]|nr:hypothetical protein MKX01_017126 [Papaver californicum]
MGSTQFFLFYRLGIVSGKMKKKLLEIYGFYSEKKILNYMIDAFKGDNKALIEYVDRKAPESSKKGNSKVPETEHLEGPSTSEKDNSGVLDRITELVELRLDETVKRLEESLATEKEA